LRAITAYNTNWTLCGAFGPVFGLALIGVGSRSVRRIGEAQQAGKRGVSSLRGGRRPLYAVAFPALPGHRQSMAHPRLPICVIVKCHQAQIGLDVPEQEAAVGALLVGLGRLSCGF
jgi:hypothetical protein